MSNESVCVLIVEDEPDLRKALAIDLETGGYRCLEAPDRGEALEVLESAERSPEVALVDLRMPSGPLAGLSLIRDIKRDPRWQCIRVIVLSARSEAETILEALRLGAIDYLVKPYEPSDLLARIERAAALEIAQSDSVELPNETQRVRGLHVEVMQVAVFAWEVVCGKSKVDLAEKSGLWSWYIDAKGTARTKTLDRYLHEPTLPAMPRTVHVLGTARFVLKHCPESDPCHGRLREAMDALERLPR